MKILLTGATGYVGQHLLGKLLKEGHEVICCARNPDRLRIPEQYADKVRTLKIDFLNPDSDVILEEGIDLAYYLIHSLSSSVDDFDSLEEKTARNFIDLISYSDIRQVVYLSGISNEKTLSKHLQSRFQVEQILKSGPVPVTTLRAGIVVGAGSASFEIIRDLVEKLPFMIAPKWLSTRCQPIAIHNVLDFLIGVAGKDSLLDKSFDIGGPDIHTYKEMLEIYGEERELDRKIITVPVLSPRLSSYWLYFVTSVSYPLAVNLVNSMKIEVVCKPNNLADFLGVKLIPYRQAVRMALDLYGNGAVYSSWKDALSSSHTGEDLASYKRVPEFGVLFDSKKLDITGRKKEVLDNLWSIGGKRGWYYGDWLWKIRGFMDKLVGGIGLRRGRTHDTHIETGDPLDFWRVLIADREEGRLLLFAEMKLPGEAWLDFKIEKKNGREILHQKAVFRPRGVLGRLYWYAVAPLHVFVFSGMIKNLVSFNSDPNNSTTICPKGDSRPAA